MFTGTKTANLLSPTICGHMHGNHSMLTVTFPQNVNCN